MPTTLTPKKPTKFPPTQWTLVAQARGMDTTESREAWSDIFEAYWYPFYGYIRRRGYSVHDAEDLTQSFFYRLISRDSLKTADPEQGKLRTFLLLMLKRFLASDWYKIHQKRRFGNIMPIDIHDAEERLAEEASLIKRNNTSPEKAYDRQWASIVLSDATESWRADFSGRHGEFAAAELLPLVIHQAEAVNHQAIADKLCESRGNVRILVHRARVEFRAFLRERVRQTLLVHEDVEDEMRYVLSILAMD